MDLGIPTPPLAVTIVVVAFVLALHVVTADETFENDYDEDINFECPKFEVLTDLYSIHANDHEDRKWRFTCRQPPSGATPGRCTWTDEYVNAWDEAVAFSCPPNELLAGLQSTHSNHHEDRRYKFRCCKDSGFKTLSCDVTDWLNDFDGELSYVVPNGKVLTGWISFHSNPKEDRRHKMIKCQYKE